MYASVCVFCSCPYSCDFDAPRTPPAPCPLHFYSQDADFAASVESSGIAWCGPTPAVMASLGDKISARAVAAEAGVPIVPGSPALHTLQDVLNAGESLGDTFSPFSPLALALLSYLFSSASILQVPIPPPLLRLFPAILSSLLFFSCSFPFFPAFWCILMAGHRFSNAVLVVVVECRLPADAEVCEWWWRSGHLSLLQSCNSRG